jgi:hypothetical protein
MKRNLKEAFELVTPVIEEHGDRFIAVQSERTTINVIDLATVDNIELAVESKHIWLGKENYINFRDLLYNETIEQLYARLVRHWIAFKMNKD